MTRKLILPALAIALLGGCATSAYQYRGGSGDYYYGQPSTQYRYYNSPYDYYGNPYGYSGYPGSGYYGFYGYGGGYGYPYLPPRRHYRGDGHHHGDHDGGDRNGDGRHRDGHDGGEPPVSDGRDVPPDRVRYPRPRPPLRDPGNLDERSPDPGQGYRPPTSRPQPTVPSVDSSSGRSGGSIGSRASQTPSPDRDRRRIHKP